MTISMDHKPVKRPIRAVMDVAIKIAWIKAKLDIDRRK
jgi:hypothetical protein